MSENESAMTTRDLAGMTPEADEPVSRDRGDDASAVAQPDQPALLESNDAADFERQWSEIQTGFVDEPRRAVEEADSLVADLMQRLAAGFAEQRSRLEGQWDRGDDVSTEDLRVALTRYRSFFQRLLQA